MPAKIIKLHCFRKKQVMELFRKINQENGTTIIIVTHDSGIGASMNRCINIFDGLIKADNSL